MMNEKAIKLAESILAKGDRVELIPVKDGVKMIRVRRKEIKQADCKSCKSWNDCTRAARSGALIKCMNFGFVQKYIRENEG